ncbi:ribbon-helix-helix domain-containing protein [Paraburkholderia caffeinilytica]|uniref:ribbon-helix-helix domain-containing protein n=1 Tax=Paraburkholderia caffeinilytica TaxID=1761016 RepID=UPI0038B8C8B5
MGEPLEAGMTTLKMPIALKQRIGQRSAKSGVSQSEIIRRGVAMYLDSLDSVESQVQAWEAKKQQKIMQSIAQEGGQNE